VLAKVDGRAMRQMNRDLLLEMIRQGKAVSRTDLARGSALTKPTVSAIVDLLIDEGLVREVGFGVSASGRGRPSSLLQLNESAVAFVGVHFGVRRTSLAAADARGQIRARKVLDSFKAQPGKAIRALPLLVKDVLREAKLPRARLKGVGIAIPGLVDHATGTCVLAPNLKWADVPVRGALARVLRTPTVVRNITQAAAIAEGRLGAAQGARSFAWVYVGSGVGASIVIDGRIVYGKHGYSGELGHCAVLDKGAPCGCGRIGCLETVASGAAIEAAARARATRNGRLQRPTGWRGFDTFAVAAAARSGDAMAREILASAAEYLGMGISYLLNLLNPEMVVLGGRVIQAGEYFVDPVRASVAKHAMRGDGIPIVPSSVGDDIMLRGAVLLAMDGESAETARPEAYAP
jgi:predicted NBD/HSP70 family sugar kinase